MFVVSGSVSQRDGLADVSERKDAVRQEGEVEGSDGSGGGSSSSSSNVLGIRNDTDVCAIYGPSSIIGSIKSSSSSNSDKLLQYVATEETQLLAIDTVHA
jgi:hypothetical protein